MYTKTVTYEDYNGIKRTEDFRFNLNEAELTEMELSKAGGLTGYINRIVNTSDTPELIKAFKELILLSYGVKSDDGRRFIKSKELSEEFTQTPAYPIIYMELATSDKAGAEFINGIIPADLAAKVAEASKKDPKLAALVSGQAPVEENN